jgi:endonuclease III
MLSSQTKDEVTDAAVGKLRTALGGTLSLDALLAAEEHVIADAISKVGFWRRKTQSVHPFPLSLALFLLTKRYLKKKVHKAGCAAPAGRL